MEQKGKKATARTYNTSKAARSGNAKETESENKKTVEIKATNTEPEESAPNVNGIGQVIYSLQSGTPIFVKTADICSAFGVSNQWVGQLTAQGIIHKVKTKYGSLYSLFDTTRAYCAFLKEKSKSKQPEISSDGENVENVDFRKKQAEARLKESKATVAELEAAEFQGQMHRSEDVQAMTADLLFYVRGSLLAVAGRCAVDCAACSEPAEVQKIIEREVFAILQDLSEYKYDKKRYDELVRQRMKRDIDSRPEIAETNKDN